MTVPQLKKVIQPYFPELVFLPETKNRKDILNKVKQKIGYDSLFVVDPVGKSGGMAVLWRKELQVRRVLFIDFIIEVLIQGDGCKTD